MLYVRIIRRLKDAALDGFRTGQRHADGTVVVDITIPSHIGVVTDELYRASRHHANNAVVVGTTTP